MCLPKGHIAYAHAKKIAVPVPDAVFKSLSPTTATVRLQGVAAASASAYKLTSKISKPEPVPELLATNSGAFTYLMPAQPVSVIVPRTGA
jgi:hypothetical protein